MSDPVDSFNEEKQSAYLYRVVADAEHDAARSALFRQLADAADSQAMLWTEVARRAGRTVPSS